MTEDVEIVYDGAAAQVEEIGAWAAVAGAAALRGPPLAFIAPVRGMLCGGMRSCATSHSRRRHTMDIAPLMETEPFLGYLGLEVVEAQTGTAVLRLPLRRAVTNHTGSVHGGAQYGLGEATAIALAATLFPERVAQLDLLTASATIAYRRPARGDLTARADLSAEECERIRAEFGERGRVRFPVAVALADADGAVATTLTVECVVRSRE